MGNYIIYGAAAMGYWAKKFLENHGMTVLGYIDKRAFEIKSYNDLPVWAVDEVPHEYLNNNTIVFVGVKNVFEHEQIARLLVKNRFEYIAYKPYNVLLGHGTEEEKRIADIYDMLYGMNGEITDFMLPKCQIENSEKLYDFAVLQEEENQVLAYIPAEFIATNNSRDGVMERWGNVNILSFFTHIDFFRSLNNCDDSSPEGYLEEYCKYAAKLRKTIMTTKSWEENVIKNRAQIYEKMLEAMNLDKDFFIRNAPTAEWNAEKHIFNLTSGKHRSTFLIARGMKYIPLKIRKEDYQQFYHKEELAKTYKLWTQSEREIAIPHPVFYRNPRNRDRGEYAFASGFARYYGKKLFYERGRVDFSGIKVLDVSDDLGNFARFLDRLGCDVVRAVEPDELETQLNKLFYANISYENLLSLKRGMKYDMVVADSAGILEVAEHGAQYDAMLVRSGTAETIDSVCKFLQLEIKEKINVWYEGKEKRMSCLLKSKNE